MLAEVTEHTPVLSVVQDTEPPGLKLPLITAPLTFLSSVITHGRFPEFLVYVRTSAFER
jgi:hypothetical protein